MRFVAFRPVRFVPLPAKVPEKFTPLEPFVTTPGGSCPKSRGDL